MFKENGQRKATATKRGWFYGPTHAHFYEWPRSNRRGLLGAAIWRPGAPVAALPRDLRLRRPGRAIASSRTRPPWASFSLLWPFFFLFGGIRSRIFTKLLNGRDRPVIALTALPRRCSWRSPPPNPLRLNFFRYIDPERIRLCSNPRRYLQTDRPAQIIDGRSPRRTSSWTATSSSTNHPSPVLGDFPAYRLLLRRHEARTRWDARLSPRGIFAGGRSREALKNSYFTTDLQLRDGQDSFKAFLDADKFFAAFFPGQDPDFDPEPTSLKRKRPARNRRRLCLPSTLLRLTNHEVASPPPSPAVSLPFCGGGPGLSLRWTKSRHRGRLPLRRLPPAGGAQEQPPAERQSSQIAPFPPAGNGCPLSSSPLFLRAFIGSSFR